MLELLFALTGIIFGVILAYITPEEVHPGEKYVLWLKRIILLAIVGFTGYFFWFRFDQVTDYLSGYISSSQLVNQLIYLVLPLLLMVIFLLFIKYRTLETRENYFSIFSLSLKFKSNYLEIVNYLLFMIIFLLLTNSVLAGTVLAVLVFLYGLPTGTLLVKDYV